MQQVFFDTASRWTHDTRVIGSRWREIHDAYTAPGRFYHTLQHLDFMYRQLQNVLHLVMDHDMIVFALFYHDFIYDPLQAGNEEASARLAEQVLQVFGVPPDRVQTCSAHILATRLHDAAQGDTEWFIDADLSILGAPPHEYDRYAVQVRREFSAVPDALFRAGRARVLERFLQRDKIFLTDWFMRYEQQARENITREMSSLNLFE